RKLGQQVVPVAHVNRGRGSAPNLDLGRRREVLAEDHDVGLETEIDSYRAHLKDLGSLAERRSRLRGRGRGHCPESHHQPGDGHGAEQPLSQPHPIPSTEVNDKTAKGLVTKWTIGPAQMDVSVTPGATCRPVCKPGR